MTHDGLCIYGNLSNNTLFTHTYNRARVLERTDIHVHHVPSVCFRSSVSTPLMFFVLCLPCLNEPDDDDDVLTDVCGVSRLATGPV